MKSATKGILLIGIAFAAIGALVVAEVNLTHAKLAERDAAPPMLLICNLGDSESYRQSARWWDYDSGAWHGPDGIEGPMYRPEVDERCHTERAPTPPQPEPQS